MMLVVTGGRIMLIMCGNIPKNTDFKELSITLVTSKK